MKIFEHLVILANNLDHMGLYKEADEIDIILKQAIDYEEQEEQEMIIKKFLNHFRNPPYHFKGVPTTTDHLIMTLEKAEEMNDKYGKELVEEYFYKVLKDRPMIYEESPMRKSPHHRDQFYRGCLQV